MQMHANHLRAMRARILSQMPVLAVSAALGACSSVSPPQVPSVLSVPANQKLALALKANGVQVYECQPSKSDPSQFHWSLRGPDATLTDSDGNPVGKHYAGPTWEYRDGSKVVGALKASAPSPDLDAVAWLLLDVKSTSGGGAFGDVKSVQRLQTAGGKPPKEGCTRDLVGNTARSPYTATYYFYVASP